jgi:type 1 glutamine amidotransferase
MKPRLLLWLRLILLMTASLCLPGARDAGAAEAKPKRLLMVHQSPDGHAPTFHEFKAGAEVMNELLKPYPAVQTKLVNADEPWPEGPQLIDQADGIVLWVTQGARWMQTDGKRYDALKRLAARGGAIIALHWSVGATNAQYIQGQLDLLGGTRGGEWRKYTVIEAEMKPVAPQHPVMTGLGAIKTYDEFYYRLELRKEIQPLYTAKIEGNDETCAWVWERPDGGRSFGFVCLHFHSNWQKPEYRRFVTQGTLWALKLPIPAGGAKTDIDSKKLELDGVLPAPASPEAEKAAKKVKADREKAEKKKKADKAK